MAPKTLLAPLAALVLAAGLAAWGDAAARTRHVTDPDAPRSLAPEGPVDVRWEDPARFSEIRYSHNSSESRRGNWVEQLALHLRKRAQDRLPAGERLAVTILDIDRAGDFEPWRGPRFHDTRFMRDVYPPRITLAFTRTDASGNVVAQGERTLRDSAYLMDSTTLSGDPLKYEKRMIERWLARELPSPRVSSR